MTRRDLAGDKVLSRGAWKQGHYPRDRHNWRTFRAPVCLDRSEMTADEGASWAAAAAPSLMDVIDVQQRLNPGRLAAHDVMLHFLMRIFGDTLRSIRFLSVLFGMILVGLVFLVAQETMAADMSPRQRGRGLSASIFNGLVASRR